MKKLTGTLLTLFFALFCIGAYAQETPTVMSKIESATIFFSGAELTHKASARLVSGESEIVIEGLSPQVDRNSIKVKTTGGVVISSFEYSIDYLSEAKANSTLIKRLEDSLNFYKARIQQTDIDIRINASMQKILSDGIGKNVSGSETGLGIDELVKTMDYYKDKSVEIETERVALQNLKTELNKSINRIQTQYNQEVGLSTKTSGVLRLSLSSPRAQSTEFTISYFTPSARWSTYYDINITSVDEPLQITAKAKVSQTTGVDWDKVRLTLSTSMPSDGKNAPLFTAWFLQQRALTLPQSERRSKIMAQNTYSYDEEYVREEVAVTSGFGRGIQAVDPLLFINGQETDIYEYYNLNRSSILDEQILSGDEGSRIYGSRGAGGVILVTLRTDISDYITSSDRDLNVTYDIALPYSIPGNGKEQNIDLSVKNAQAEYKYYAVPKLDSETYVLAEISGWESLGLMSGPANITFDGTYLGETYIDASSTQNKLTLTLGTENRIAVKREVVRDFTSSKTIGNDVQQIFTYRITVRNNLNKQARLVVKDQYPISTQKNIEVVLRKETTPWSVNVEELGVLTWEDDFAPGETKTYEISYSVKYPKSMKLNL